MNDWRIPPERLAEFVAKHGPIKVKRTTGPAARKKTMTAEDEFGERLKEWMPDAVFVRELVFHPTRKWRFDYAFPEQKLAVEIDGQGRHQRYVGYREDCAKGNAAILHGWRVLHFVAAERKHIDDWVETTIRALSGLDDL